jgi:hypothetical protein
MSVSIAYNNDVQAQHITDLQEIIYKMSSSVFDSITKPEQISKISQTDVKYALNNLVAIINTKDAFSYLTENDGYYTRRLTTAIADNMRDILLDSEITITDVPIFLKMIKEITISVNNIHAKQNAVVQISIHSFVPLIQTVILLSCQMFLPKSQYDIAKMIIIYAFQLIETNLDPVAIGKKLSSCFPLRASHSSLRSQS